MKQIAEFKDYLLARNFATQKNVSYFISWVSKYLDFKEHLPETEKPRALELYLAKLQSWKGIADWQIHQASQSIEIYQKLYLAEKNEPGDMLFLPEETNSVLDIKNILEKLKIAIRIKHYAYSTEKTYLEWTARFLHYTAQKNGGMLREQPSVIDIKEFLSFLAVQKKVSSSTQNQAFGALLFLFRNVFQIDPKDLNDTLRAKRGPKLPTVLSTEELQKLLSHMKGNHLLMAHTIYGSGLRLMELVRLRVKDIDFDARAIIVRDGKGNKDRATILPKAVQEPLRNHLLHVREIHEQDITSGVGPVFLPNALDRKYPNAGKEWAWQYVFPSTKLSVDPRANMVRRHHMDETSFQKAVKNAANKSGIPKQINVHTLRHCFATHLLMKGVNIREIQELLGHKSVETTMIYTHVMKNLSTTPESPLDELLANS